MFAFYYNPVALANCITGCAINTVTRFMPSIAVENKKRKKKTTPSKSFVGHLPNILGMQHKTFISLNVSDLGLDHGL